MGRRSICAASFAVLLISQAEAVEVGKPSKTSISSAARRALTARDYDPTIRNPDWLAEVFLGPTEREILAGDAVMRNLDRDYREATEQTINNGQHLIRTRFFDERLRLALSKGAAQVVILGAGYDSRAYRMRQLLKDVRTLQEIHPFSYEEFTRRCSTVDVVWFNDRLMPKSLFEIEHSTDFQNSLIKFSDLQDFYTRMIIVTDDLRKREFLQKIQSSVFAEISTRVNFLGYESLVKQYEMDLLRSNQVFLL